MKFLRIAIKDLRTEFRTKGTINFLFLFAFLSIMLFSATVGDPEPALLWVVFIFAGMLGYSRAFLREVETGTLDALRISPVSPSSILFGKIVYNAAIMLILEVFVIPVFMAVFGIYPKNVLLSVIILTAGNLAFVIVSSSLSVLVIKSRARELLLPVLLFPIVFPVIISTVQAFTMAVSGNLDGIQGPISVILGFSTATLAVGYLTIDYALIE